MTVSAAHDPSATAGDGRPAPHTGAAPAAAGPALDWLPGDVPFSRAFGDSYFSRAGGLAEARHVFLAGNGLPARFRPGFRIAELGFGTGLNLVAALIAWRAAGIPGRLSYTGFECDPLDPAAAARALAAFPEAAGAVAPALELLAGGRVATPEVEARLVLGDAAETLPAWPGTADAWFLDGFAPDRNPGLWSPALMAEVARHTAPGGSFATYSAAGRVRRALAAAGFAVRRLPGYGQKRHMSAGVLPE